MFWKEKKWKKKESLYFLEKNDYNDNAKLVTKKKRTDRVRFYVITGYHGSTPWCF